MRDIGTLLQEATDAQAAGTSQAWWENLSDEERERLLQYVADAWDSVQEIVTRFVDAVQALAADVLSHLGVPCNGDAEQ